MIIEIQKHLVKAHVLGQKAFSFMGNYFIVEKP